jgi:hypothetical protein
MMRDNDNSVIDSCPPEIWTQIFYHACTDTGFTGRSVSATCRHFHELAKCVKLRSVALFSTEQIIAFVKLAEALPCWERVIENLYLTTYGLPLKLPNSKALDGAYPPADLQALEEALDRLEFIAPPPTVNISQCSVLVLFKVPVYFPA